MYYRVLGPLVVATAVASGLGGLPATPGTELVVNGRFDRDAAGWTVIGDAGHEARGGRLCVTSPGQTKRVYDTVVESGGVPLRSGGSYVLSFRGTTAPTHQVHVIVTGPAPDFHEHLRADVLVESGKVVSLPFVPERDEVAVLSFQLGTRGAAYRMCLDEVSVRGPRGTVPQGEQVRNGGFDRQASGWSFYGFSGTATSNGQFCGDVPAAGDHPWDVAVFQRSAYLERGRRYRVKARLAAYPSAGTAPGGPWAVPPAAPWGPGTADVRLLLNAGATPYAGYEDWTVPLAPGRPVAVEKTFTSTTDDAAAAVTVQVGTARLGPWRFCLDDVSLQVLP